jgi:CheY-like chemotaxis protein
MKASRRAAEISHQMLAYLGQDTGKKEPIDLSEAYREALLLLTASLPKKARLKTEFPAEGVIILADAVQMKQVLTNLVVNAGEAMGGGEGDITVAIALIPAADIHASRFYPAGWKPKAETYACLSITDTGCGMDPETVDKLFDPFFSTKFTGRGLGLPVVMGIVKAHEGAVTVESGSGQGATFRVFLPVTDQKPLQTRKAEPVESRAVEGRGLVLVVEDEPLMRELAEIMLQHIGYEVITAADGVEAREVFQQHKDEIRCVLCDLTMPRMDGWETLEALRRIQPDLAVILASGYAETQVMQGEHPERPQVFLHKPYMSADLGAALAAALKGHR